MAWEDGVVAVRCGDDDGDHGLGKESRLGLDDLFYNRTCVSGMDVGALTDGD